MTLIQAINEGHTVLIQFVSVKRNAQWGITFNKPSDLAKFFTPIVGTLEDVGEPTPEKPFRFYKAIFVSDEPPENEPLEPPDGTA